MLIVMTIRTHSVRLRLVVDTALCLDVCSRSNPLGGRMKSAVHGPLCRGGDTYDPCMVCQAAAHLNIGLTGALQVHADGTVQI